MNTKKLRDILFPLHRYIGLAIGLLLIIIGLTGSLLVFQDEIDHAIVTHQFGRVISQTEQLPLGAIVHLLIFSNRMLMGYFAHISLP